MDVIHPRGWDRSSSSVDKQGQVEPVRITALGWVPLLVGTQIYRDMASTRGYYQYTIAGWQSHGPSMQFGC